MSRPGQRTPAAAADAHLARLERRLVKGLRTVVARVDRAKTSRAVARAFWGGPRVEDLESVIDCRRLLERGLDVRELRDRAAQYAARYARGCDDPGAMRAWSAIVLDVRLRELAERERAGKG